MSDHIHLNHEMMTLFVLCDNVQHTTYFYHIVYLMARNGVHDGLYAHIVHATACHEVHEMVHEEVNMF